MQFHEFVEALCRVSERVVVNLLNYGLSQASSVHSQDEDEEEKAPVEEPEKVPATSTENGSSEVAFRQKSKAQMSAPRTASTNKEASVLPAGIGPGSRKNKKQAPQHAKVVTQVGEFEYDIIDSDDELDL